MIFWNGGVLIFYGAPEWYPTYISVQKLHDCVFYLVVCENKTNQIFCLFHIIMQLICRWWCPHPWRCHFRSHESIKHQRACAISNLLHPDITNHSMAAAQNANAQPSDHSTIGNIDVSILFVDTKQQYTTKTKQHIKQHHGWITLPLQYQWWWRG